MSHDMPLRLINKKDLLSRLTISNSTLHLRIRQGLMTPPIDLGGRRVGWPEYELNSLISALISGCSSNEIKNLVSQLVTDRKNGVVR